MSSAVSTRRIRSFDGATIACHELGRGRPFVLLHGLFSNAEVNWLRWGTASTLAESGFRVIMPDFRAHGESDAPLDAAAYPPDVLALDIETLVRELALGEFDLGGYSLGARTTIRLIVRGMRPRRAVLAGMGLEGVIQSDERTRFFLRVIETRQSADIGTPEWLAAQFMKTNGIDPDAAAHLLRSQVQTTAEDLARIAMPTLVVCGSGDHDNGSAAELASILPDARHVSVPGNHLGAATRAELGAAIRDFLAGPS